jgi:hypothetical protein
MVGLIVKHLGRMYKIGCVSSGVSIVSSLVLHRDEFILEGCGFIQSFQKIREGIEFEVEVAEFDESSELITEDNDFSEIDPEYFEMIEKRNPEWEWEQKLKIFHQIKCILKEEGLISE